jgi:hypothetical protein
MGIGIYIATNVQTIESILRIIATIGTLLLGGCGAGFLWTAQGTYLPDITIKFYS